MDILSSLNNILGQSATATAPGQQNRNSGLGGLGSLINMLGAGSGTGTNANRSAAGSDPLAGLGSLVGALLANKGGVPASGAASTGGLGALIGSLMGSNGGEILGRLLGGAKPPPAPKAGQDTDTNRSVNLLRALVYAARADGTVDDNEEAAITRHMQQAGLGTQVQRLVSQFMDEEMDPENIARNITSPEEALQIYAMSCALTRRDTFMERNYLDALAHAMRIPDTAKTAIEQKMAA